MPIKVGLACGTCSVCGKQICRQLPEDSAICDCWKYCPVCAPAFTVPMDPYTPDLTPTTYEAGEMKILMRCPVCGYESAQKPVEVRLT